MFAGRTRFGDPTRQALAARSGLSGASHFACAGLNKCPNRPQWLVGIIQRDLTHHSASINAIETDAPPQNGFDKQPPRSPFRRNARSMNFANRALLPGIAMGYGDETT